MRIITFTRCALLVALLGLSPVETPTAAAQECDPPPDQTTEVQALVDATPDGGMLDLTGQSFIVESIVKLDHPMTLQGGTFVAETDGSCVPVPPDEKAATWPGTRRHVDVTGTDVTIRGLTVDGPNAACAYSHSLEFQHGIALGTGTLMEDVTVTEVHGDGVTSGDGGGNGATVRSTTLDCIGRQGVGVTSGLDLLFDGLTISRVARSGFDVEPICVGPAKENCLEARRITLANSTFTQITNFAAVVVGYTVNTSDIAFIANTFDGTRAPFIMATGGKSFCCEPVRSAGLTIIGNTSTQVAANTAVTVENWDGVIIRSNTLPVRLPPKATQVSWLRLTNSVSVLIGVDNDQGVGDIEIR